MFSKPKSEPNTGQTTLGAATQPVSFAAPAADPRRSVLHDGIRIEGNWTSDGIVDFGGTIVGDLTADTIILTKTGKITGNIRARHVTIEGAVNGSISAYTLSIRSTAMVQAPGCRMCCRTLTPSMTSAARSRIRRWSQVM